MITRPKNVFKLDLRLTVILRWLQAQTVKLLDRMVQAYLQVGWPTEVELSASVALLVEVEDLVDRDPAVQDPAVQDLAVQDPVVQDPVVQDPVVQDLADRVLADRVLADQDLADRDLVVTVQEFPLEAKLTLALAVESAAVEVDQAVPAAETQSIRQTPTWSTSTAIVLEPVTTVINQINTVVCFIGNRKFYHFPFSWSSLSWYQNRGPD